MSETATEEDGIIIEKEVVIAVEGSNFKQFLEPRKSGLGNVQILDFKRGGLELKSWLGSFRGIRGFDKIKAFGIICDAEISALSMQQSIESLLRVNGFATPERPKGIAQGDPNVSYLIVPDGESSGCLEHAMLKASSPELPQKCAEDFLGCVEAYYEQNDIQMRKEEFALENWRAKVKVNSLIASSKKPEMSMGVSVHRDMWDWTQPSLKVMLDFIEDLAHSY